ncbi:hypothetical protein [Arthrobacter sp. JSM 101049]|uniref:hypothetical protein n=1 Tax=Arthrobacter sp. JSM 101049 TaxID=929097 RepID=UPI003566C8D9
MNKTNIERSLAILEADLAQGRAGARRGGSRQQEGVRPATMPGDFPSGIHPDDWEPDDEVERGPVIGDPKPGPRPW